MMELRNAAQMSAKSSTTRIITTFGSSVSNVVPPPLFDPALPPTPPPPPPAGPPGPPVVGSFRNAGPSAGNGNGCEANCSSTFRGVEIRALLREKLFKVPPAAAATASLGEKAPAPLTTISSMAACCL
ncbi:hypothetical protein Mapa_007813 [Marchantia paleacea]|nr:hypothetical protein Mapa_007813 [Marchantia paleacea]